MEDYVEMMCRLSKEQPYIRIKKLSENLNVRPSSSSKMMSLLKEMQLVSYEKYGIITLTEKGFALGEYLLHRHEVLHRFFCLLNRSEEELQQTEQIEHFINEKTLSNIEELLPYLKEIKENK